MDVLLPYIILGLQSFGVIVLGTLHLREYRRERRRLQELRDLEMRRRRRQCHIRNLTFCDMEMTEPYIPKKKGIKPKREIKRHKLV